MVTSDNKWMHRNRKWTILSSYRIKVYKGLSFVTLDLYGRTSILLMLMCEFYCTPKVLSPDQNMLSKIW